MDIYNNDNENRINEIKMQKSELNSVNILYDACKSTVKIITKTGLNVGMASGFFILLEKNNKPFHCIMTNEHVITKEMIESQKYIEIYYDNQHKKLNIKLDNTKRCIKEFRYLKLDISIVEILPEDNVNNDFFLLQNLEYTMGYDNFLNKNIFIPQFPKGGNLNNSIGKIIEINSFTFDFSHSASTEQGSSGSPIFLEGTIYVIGIHKQGNKKKVKNYGNFIGPVVDFFKNEVSNNKKNYPNGEYIGELINNMREGYGKFTYKDGHCYIGTWKNDIPNGKGTLYFNNKVEFEGDFVNEEFDGNGKLFLNNGDFQTGDFSKGKSEGFGEYCFKNGEKYIGEFANGLENGQGILYNKDGSINYEGEFKNSIKEGRGILHYPDGTSLEANFIKGEIKGKVSLYNSLGKLYYYGELLDNLFHGFGEYYYENGNYYKGEFYKGKKHGKGILYYSKDGQKKYEGIIIMI